MSIAVSAVLGLFVSCIGAAQAQVLFQAPLSTQLEGIYSIDKGQQIAARFTPTQSGSVTHVTWYGLWSNPAVEVKQLAARTARFNVRFFADAGGKPATSPLREMTLQAKVQATLHRLNLPKQPLFNGRVVYRFDADLSTGILLHKAQPVWLSISTSDTIQWLWARSTTNVSIWKYRILSNGPQWNEKTSLGQPAFTLAGKQTAGR